MALDNNGTITTLPCERSWKGQISTTGTRARRQAGRDWERREYPRHPMPASGCPISNAPPPRSLGRRPSAGLDIKSSSIPDRGLDRATMNRALGECAPSAQVNSPFWILPRNRGARIESAVLWWMSSSAPALGVSSAASRAPAVDADIGLNARRCRGGSCQADLEFRHGRQVFPSKPAGRREREYSRRRLDLEPASRREPPAGG